MNKPLRVRLRRDGPLRQEDFLSCLRGEVMQICRAVVEEQDREIPVALFLVNTFSEQPSWSSAAWPVAVAAAGNLAAFVRHSEQGRVNIEPRPEGEAGRYHLAAVAAVMAVSWGWDESPEILVSTAGQDYRFALSWDGHRWSVRCVDG